MASCGAHAGPCPTATNSEGTWCTLSGVELAGPALVCHDMRQCCNAVVARVPLCDRPRRAAASLHRAERQCLSAPRWVAALRALYPHLTPGAAERWSASLRAWSSALSINRVTHPALRTWAMLFTATVTSKLAAGGARAADGVLLPRVATFAAHAPPHASYPRHGIGCRSMSHTWRQILTAALSRDGNVRIPFTSPMAPATTPPPPPPPRRPRLPPPPPARPLATAAPPAAARTVAASTR